LGREALNARTTVAAVFPDLPKEYVPVAKALFRLSPFGDVDASVEYSFLTNDVVETRRFVSPDAAVPHIRFTHDRHGKLFIVELIPSRLNHFTSGATAYADLLSRKRVTGSVALAFQKDFANDSELPAFVREHPSFDVTAIHPASINRVTSADFRMPKPIQEAFVRYWKSTTRPSTISLFLDTISGLGMRSTVGIKDVQFSDSGVTISFCTVNGPQFRVATAER